MEVFLLELAKCYLTILITVSFCMFIIITFAWLIIALPELFKR